MVRASLIVAHGIGLTHALVIDAAAAIVDELGTDAVTLASLATRLGVRSQSLYAHVDGLDGLRHDLAVHAQHRLGADIGRAVMGRSGPEALRAACHAYAGFASRHPGLYACCQRAPQGDPALEGSAAAATEPWFAVLQSFDLTSREVIHFHRVLWAALHGFVSLRNHGLMTRAASPDRSFDLLVETFVDALTSGRR